MNLHIFSFFSGAGFLDLGFEKQGFDIVYVNEIDKDFMEAYKYSRLKMNLKFPEYGFNQESITKLLENEEFKNFKKLVTKSKKSGALVGFIGGPPCPDFSVAGKNRGRHGENGKLSKSYIDLIIKSQPDFFLFENVKGLYRTKKHREFFESLKTSLQKNNYLLSEKLINSLEYGAPQDRERIILIGFNKKNFESSLPERYWKKFTSFEIDAINSVTWPVQDEQGKNRPKPKNIIQELTIDYWFKKNKVAVHPNQKHVFVPRAALAKFRVIPEGDVSKKSFKRLHAYRYSPTAAYGNNEVHIHPRLPRRITVAEALAIQSLPAKFELPPSISLTSMFKTIGNGVPFEAAFGIARMIKMYIKSQSI